MAANATLGPTIGLFTVPTTGGAQFHQRIGGHLGFTKLSKTVVPIPKQHPPVILQQQQAVEFQQQLAQVIIIPRATKEP